jgi:hypothetical protein
MKKYRREQLRLLFLRPKSIWRYPLQINREPTPTTQCAEQAAQGDFDAAERAYIRRELDEYLASLPAAADGFFVRIRRTGPTAGEPKVPPAGQSLLERGLMRLERHPSPRLFFTETGWDALRRMMSDPRQADPKEFAHIRKELGID